MKIRFKFTVFMICTVLCLSLLMQGCFGPGDDGIYDGGYDYSDTDADYEDNTPTADPYDYKDDSEPVKVITSEGFQEGVIARYKSVYDADDLYLISGMELGVTADMCIEVLNSNKKITGQMREYLTDFIRRIDVKYPDASLDILYKNLKTLKVVEATLNELYEVTHDTESLACYQISENTIYVRKGADFVEGTGDFQILFHEFSHAARLSKWTEKENGLDINYSIAFQTSLYKHEILEEAMNSVFACSLLNYYERDITYQIPSNYMRIMLECMDNYSLDDYLNHSDLYFLSKLDEFMGTVGHAETVWKLIVLQRDDWDDWSEVNVDGSRFFPIYDCLCKMYYDKYITPGMTDAEKTAVADELVDKAFYDAAEGYKIDPDYFYQYLKDNY